MADGYMGLKLEEVKVRAFVRREFDQRTGLNLIGIMFF